MAASHSDSRISDTSEKKESPAQPQQDYSSIFVADQSNIPLSSIIVPGRTMTADQIYQEFNEGLKTRVFTPANFRLGFVTAPNTFSLGYRYKNAELGRSINGERIVRQWFFNPWVSAGLINEEIPQNAKCYGAFGKYVVNVSYGCYAKVWDGNIPKLLGPGTHIIKSGNFKYGTHLPEHGYIKDDKAEVNQVDEYITHGNNIHIIRVASGKIAKITVNNQPMFLESRTEPYVFTTANFVFNPENDYADQNALYMANGTKHRLRVPAGQIATVTIGTEKRLIESGTHEFSNPFTLDKTIDEVTRTEVNLRNTGDHLIQHGPIKRILPGINEVAVTNNSGELRIIDAFKMIDDPNHTFVEWVNTSVQTFEFPSQETKNKRTKEGIPLTDATFELFTTRDSMKVGVKLLVAYRISNPTLALKELGSNKGIKDHIEGVVTTDMGKAIQQCTSQEFLACNDNKPASDEKGVSFSENYQDKVKKQLAKDLKEYGIELIRMNVQESKLQDESISKEMSKSVISSATANAQQAIMKQQTLVAENEANRLASVKKIAVQQENENIVSRANADLDAARKRAEAKIIEAKAEAEASTLQASVFDQHEKLLEFRKAELIANAISKSNSKFFIAPAEFSSLLGAVTLFGSSKQSLAASSAQPPMNQEIEEKGKNNSLK